MESQFMRKQPFFKSAEIQKRFDSDGYVVIDFIPPDLVKNIATFFYRQYQEIPRGFFAAVTNPDDALKHTLFLQIDALLNNVLESTFINYKKLGSTFLCKAPGVEGKVHVHQDWTVVDEKEFCSATIWIPLQDVDEENGALRVLPGSHTFFNKFRNNHIPVSYRGNEQLLWDNMLTIPMKAGQAFILNHAVIHASSPNLTNKERLVLAYAITSANAPLRFYFRSEYATDNKVEQFEMPDDFLLRYHNLGERPLIGKKVAEFDYQVPAIDTTEISQMIENERSKRNNILYFNQYWKSSEISKQRINGEG